jgi:hypothetical protein
MASFIMCTNVSVLVPMIFEGSGDVSRGGYELEKCRFDHDHPPLSCMSNV